MNYTLIQLIDRSMDVFIVVGAVVVIVWKIISMILVGVTGGQT